MGIFHNPVTMSMKGKKRKTEQFRLESSIRSLLPTADIPTLIHRQGRLKSSPTRPTSIRKMSSFHHQDSYWNAQQICPKNRKQWLFQSPLRSSLHLRVSGLSPGTITSSTFNLLNSPLSTLTVFHRFGWSSPTTIFPFYATPTFAKFLSYTT
jgi:hypothetical protein